MIRPARTRTSGDAPWEGAHPAMMRAWAWWPIIPLMNATSAGVTECRTLSAIAAPPGGAMMTGAGAGRAGCEAAGAQAVVASAAISSEWVRRVMAWSCEEQRIVERYYG